MVDTTQKLKADKGLKNGSCNRTACQDPGANFFNRSTKAYYCEYCARRINNFDDTRKYCQETFGNPDLCVRDDGDVDLRFQPLPYVKKATDPTPAGA